MAAMALKMRRGKRNPDGSVTLSLYGSPGPACIAELTSAQICELVDTRKIAKALRVSMAGYQQIRDTAYALGLRKGHPKRKAFLRAALNEGLFTSNDEGKQMRRNWIEGNS